MNKLREIFSNEINPIKAHMMRMVIEALKEPQPTLAQKDESSKLYKSDPFRGFVSDCEHCSHYVDSFYDFVEGGNCGLDWIPCGWGFTCKDFERKDPKTVEEQIKDIENALMKAGYELEE